MRENPEPQLVAVFESRGQAVRASAAAREAGARDVRVGDPADERLALQAEMRGEMEHTVVGPGNVGPFTREMSKGIGAGVAVATVVGALIALPFAALQTFGLPLLMRLLIAAVVGGFAGATVGFMLGGGFSPRNPEAPLAAEEGTVVVVDADGGRQSSIEAALRRVDGLIRLDVAVAGQPVATQEEQPDHAVTDVSDPIVRGDARWTHDRSRSREHDHR